MSAETFTIVWSGTQEKAGFETLLRDRPELGGWLKMGVLQARKHAVPRVWNGVAGRTAESIDAFIQQLTDDGLKALRQGHPSEQADEDECFVWRLGFASTAELAKRKVLGLPAVVNC